VLEKPKEGLDRCESHVAGGRSIVAFLLKILQKDAHECSVDLLKSKSRWGDLQALRSPRKLVLRKIAADLS
jgi:hypothetical protein